MATTTKKSKFESQLMRDNKQIRADRARRIGESVTDAQTKLIMQIRGDIRKKEDELAAMTDLSTDNQNTSMNVIAADFNPDAFVERINTLKVEINLLQIKLRIAEETQAEWF
jgi:hypothetical protein